MAAGFCASSMNRTKKSGSLVRSTSVNRFVWGWMLIYSVLSLTVSHSTADVRSSTTKITLRFLRDLRGFTGSTCRTTQGVAHASEANRQSRAGTLASVCLDLATGCRRSGAESTDSDLRVRPDVPEAAARELGDRSDRRSGRRSAGSPLCLAATRRPADE